MDNELQRKLRAAYCEADKACTAKAFSKKPDPDDYKDRADYICALHDWYEEYHSLRGKAEGLNEACALAGVSGF